VVRLELQCDYLRRFARSRKTDALNLKSGILDSTPGRGTRTCLKFSRFCVITHDGEHRYHAAELRGEAA
jgi:hypothetical protein